MASQTRWALITGVSEGGLGDALTTAFLARGVSVIASSLDLKLLEYLPKEAGKLQYVQLDVASTESISAAVKQVEAITGGRLDFLVNNAGYGYMAPLLEASIPKVRAEYEVNVFGLLAVTQAFFPLLRAAKGIVVNQSSIAGLRSGCQPFIGAYSSSKAAVTAMSNAMRVEFEPFGVKVRSEQHKTHHSELTINPGRSTDNW
jgi:NAD(P)-dependent dehydrogenase (short-subunit alcohol dehydrogenase family)